MTAEDSHGKRLCNAKAPCTKGMSIDACLGFGQIRQQKANQAQGGLLGSAPKPWLAKAFAVRHSPHANGTSASDKVKIYSSIAP